MCFAHTIGANAIELCASRLRARQAYPPYPRPPAREMHVTRFLILPAGIPKLLDFKSLGEFLPVRVTNVSYIRPAARLAVRRRRPPRPPLRTPNQPAHSVVKSTY
jgi:hypothetical protein